MGRGGVVGGEEPRVEHRDREDPYPALLAQGQELGGGGLFEQGVPPGDHDDVEVALADRTDCRRHAVDADPDLVDQSGLPQMYECRQPLPQSLVETVDVGVVEEEGVDAVEAESFE